MRAVERDRDKRRTRLKQRKAARRRTRLRNESPGQRVAREARLTERVSRGESVLQRMFAELTPVLARGKHTPRPVPVACTCMPPRNHGPHWIVPTEDEEHAIQEAA